MVLSNAERQKRHRQRLKAAATGAEYRAQFLTWCRQRRDFSQRHLANLESGKVTTGKKSAAGEWIETTREEVAACRLMIAEMSAFIEQFETND